MSPLPPAPPIAASLILPVIFWGQNYVFRLLIFSFCYSLLILRSFLIFTYSSQLIFLSLLILLVLFFVFLFFSSYILNFLLYQYWQDTNPSFLGAFRGSQPFFYPFGVKADVLYVIRPNFFVFSFLIDFWPFFLLFSSSSLLFNFYLFISSYSFCHISSYNSLIVSSFSSSSISSSSNSSLLIFKQFVVLQTCILNTHWAKVPH